MHMNDMRDPFHEGERHVQERTGEREAALRNGVIVGTVIPSRALPFIAQQRMLALGSVDEEGAVWASVWFGARGFVSSPDGGSVVIERTLADPGHDDVAWSNLRVGVDVALLAIDLESRRRLRINGVVRALDEERVEVSVREAYPNCPKYIQRRQVRGYTGARPDAEPAVRGVALDDVRSRLIERADTLFVASRHPARGLDVSHRGGEPGFARVVGANRLRIPDYHGNSMFNTIGNLMVDDRAGLLFLDFEGGRLLQLTGTAAVRFDVEEDPRQPTGGTGRYWDFHVARWADRPATTRFAWESLDASPYNPGARV